MNNKNFCALCEKPIEISNNSREHIIPRSIGGRRKIRSFICIDCNSRSGDSWDAEIWQQFSHVAMMHGVERERGDPPDIKIQTIDGKHYLLLPDGSMTIPNAIYQTEPSEKGLRIHITARDELTAHKMVRQVAKKNPKVDAASFLRGMTVTETPLETPITFSAQFGGELAGRSMVKTAVALAVASGVSVQSCDTAMQYLKNDTATPPYAFFYLRNLVMNRPSTHAFNCVSVLSIPSKRKLLGYVEYFSMSRIAIILSEQYDGPMVNATYSFNPASNSELDLNVDLNLSENELELIRTNQAFTTETYAAALKAGFDIIYNRSQSRHLEREASNAFEYVCKTMEIPKEGIIPLERAQEFSKLFADYFVSKISHMIRH
ncbi:HNH endonuclease [Pseudomonas vanderleydeniana]|uniref:HNH endonuclease n=1 Tax=Pseudomonas vanderleydeniana TaxID=2745495 RepID=A0A9E6PPR8_9PSED|nr:HNH endonuclease [Pseudomonas vanderleydeniana]QXI30530.1 HNH endonuclease [Pseudomonas vanderleydeniana]